MFDFHHFNHDLCSFMIYQIFIRSYPIFVWRFDIGNCSICNQIMEINLFAKLFGVDALEFDGASLDGCSNVWALLDRWNDDLLRGKKIANFHLIHVHLMPQFIQVIKIYRFGSH